MIKTTAQLQQRFVEISEDNSFPKNFGTGENLIGLPPNDIYQLGFAAAFFECNRAVNQYVNAQTEEGKGILDQQTETDDLVGWYSPTPEGK